MKNPLVIITGPTAAGKSALSIELAQRINGAVISADSMQVYKYMDIGTNKIRAAEMGGIDHYLIDVLEPTEDFNVAAFKSMADDAIDKIRSEGKVPIIVGGTGFYIQAVLYDIDFTEADETPEYRSELMTLASEKGASYLHDMLKEVDPESAESIHPNNIKRVVRALEFYHQTGTVISEHNRNERLKESAYDFVYFVLTDDRARLYSKIDDRVDAMIEEGLVDEVKKLRSMGCDTDSVAMQGLGYKEVIEYLKGDCTLEDAVYRIKRDTRHYAKRQLTWFKRERDVTWINKGEFADKGDILRFMEDRVRKVCFE